MLHRVLILTCAPMAGAYHRLCREMPDAAKRSLSNIAVAARTDGRGGPIPLCHVGTLTKKGYIEKHPGRLFDSGDLQGWCGGRKKRLYASLGVYPGPAGHPGCYCPYPQSANVLRGGLL